MGRAKFPEAVIGSDYKKITRGKLLQKAVNKDKKCRTRAPLKVENYISAQIILGLAGKVSN